MLELVLGLFFLILMITPFSFGAAVSETELPSIGLGLLVLGYIAYFHGVFLPFPTIINEGLIASFAIVDSIFIIFFGLDIATFGAQNLLVFLISLSITYSILKQVFGTIPVLSDRASEFIVLAVLFVIARTTAIGGVNIIYAVGSGLMNLLFPDCVSLAGSNLYTAGFVIMGMVMILFGLATGLSGGLRMLMLLFGLFWAFLPNISLWIFEEDVTKTFQFCMYYWVLQLAMVLFLLNWVFQTLAMDWMGGLVARTRGE